MSKRCIQLAYARTHARARTHAPSPPHIPPRSTTTRTSSPQQTPPAHTHSRAHPDGPHICVPARAPLARVRTYTHVRSLCTEPPRLPAGVLASKHRSHCHMEDFTNTNLDRADLEKAVSGYPVYISTSEKQLVAPMAHTCFDEHNALCHRGSSSWLAPTSCGGPALRQLQWCDSRWIYRPQHFAVSPHHHQGPIIL
jgi:hypothetical protein